MGTLKWGVVFLLSFGLCASGSETGVWVKGQPVQSIEPEENPFWRRKEKLHKRLLEERDIIVAVKARPGSKGTEKEELFMQGAGVVDAPVDFTYQQAKRFSDYPRMSNFVKSGQYDENSGLLKLHTEAFGYHAHLTLQMEFRDLKQEWKEIRFRVISGVFTGMTGVVRFDDVSKKRCEISLTSLFAFNELPMPRFFVEFGLEVALRIMATRMRSFAEREFREKVGA